MEVKMRTLVIPVYKNIENLPDLLEALSHLYGSLNNSLQITFVVDASPDDCESYLLTHLPSKPFSSLVIRHSRNFGSFAAIRTGLEQSTGDFFAVMSADLQEPPELVKKIFESLESGEADIVLCSRDSRMDPIVSKLFSNTYWAIYRKWLFPEIPRGGVDIFGCTRQVKAELVRFRETKSSLIGQLMWVGYRRKFIGYQRAKRKHGVSAWTFKKKIDYFLDSIFAFSDLPIRFLLLAGFLGVQLSALITLITVVCLLLEITTYNPSMAILLAVCFFGSSNLLGLGIVGTYVQRAYENSKGRPLSIVANRVETSPPNITNISQ